MTALRTTRLVLKMNLHGTNLLRKGGAAGGENEQEDAEKGMGVFHD